MIRVMDELYNDDMNQPGWPKAIIHLDMDAFYPSVEMLDDPGLKGKPVIVGGTSDRGVVSSASYEARKFGVHSAQPIARAMRLCPKGIFLPVRMSRYQQISRQVFEIFHLFTPLVEPLSIDEAFLDVTGSVRLFGMPQDIALKIKQRVLSETGLTVSAGVSSLKFVAKIASDMDKPDGLTVVPPDQIKAFLDPLPIHKMWGVGQKTLAEMSRLKIFIFRDLQQMPLEVLEKKFGRQGVKMHRLSMGIDTRQVVPEQDAHSMGHEVTFSRDIMDPDAARKELLSLAMKVARRMRRNGLFGKTVALKVKYGNFSLCTRSATLARPTDDGAEIYATVCRLLEKTKAGKSPIRLLGISLSHFSPTSPEEQLSLFDRRPGVEKRKRLNAALDSLSDKFGKESIRPGTLYEK
ncbi:MAG: DNA polymerase IV [Desulfobacterales bacterium]|nr:DNA polymerase IV [Desulfobacterales bacterium]